MIWNDSITIEFNNFCENMKKLRIENNLTKKAMAEKLNVTTRTIRMLENHQIPVTLTVEKGLRRNYNFQVNESSLVQTSHFRIMKKLYKNDRKM